MNEPESLDEQYLMEDAGFGGQDITYDVDPPEYQHPEDDAVLRVFDEYERITDENLDTEQTS